MSDFPDTRLPPLNLITPWSIESISAGNLLQSSTPTASGLYVQNQAYFYPFRLEVVATAVKMFVVVGATGATGNIDLGIYDGEFNMMVTLGATALGTANTLQEGNITDTTLQPGIYWMAFSGSSATGTTFRAAIADEAGLSIAPLYMQSSAHPLPTTTATPVKNTEGNPLIHVMGVSFDTLI